MSTPFLADLEEIVYPSVAPASDGRYRIDTQRVLPGMYVAELDRPWADTPLPAGGLLVASEAELAAIRHHCRYVTVDAARSGADLLAAIRAAAVLSSDRSPELQDIEPTGRDETRAAGPLDEDEAQRKQRARHRLRRRAEALRHEVANARQHARNDVHPSELAQARIRRLLREAAPQRPADEHTTLPARLRGWLGLNGRRAGPDAAEGTHAAPGLPALRAVWGAAIGAVEVPVPAPLRDTLTAARPLHARLVAAADRALRQVRLGRPLVLEPVVEAADEFAGALMLAPDAMRWLGAVYAQSTPVPNPAVAVALHLAEFGRALGMARASIAELVLTGLLADIGKALLPRELVEHPGVLAPQDYALMKQHVKIGLDVLARAGELPEPVLHGIAQHHERLDGSGYPEASRGPAIGLYGRMAGIVDSFCALTAARPYANPLSTEDALAALHDWSASLFDRGLVERFVLAIGVYPIGTLVELAGGEVAAVVGRSRDAQRLQPKLVVLTGADKGPLRPVQDRTGQQDPDEVYDGARVHIARGLPAGAFGLRLRDYYAREPAGL